MLAEHGYNALKYHTHFIVNKMVHVFVCVCLSYIFKIDSVKRRSCKDIERLPLQCVYRRNRVRLDGTPVGDDPV